MLDAEARPNRAKSALSGRLAKIRFQGLSKAAVPTVSGPFLPVDLRPWRCEGRAASLTPPCRTARRITGVALLPLIAGRRGVLPLIAFKNLFSLVPSKHC